HGGLTLVGHCYEAGSLSLPYLPFVEGLGSYVRDRPEEELRAELGDAASELARIVPELRGRLGAEPAPSSGEPAEDRYHLLSAVAEALRGIGARQPLLLVLEDLHDADRGT